MKHLLFAIYFILVIMLHTNELTMMQEAASWFATAYAIYGYERFKKSNQS